MRQLVTLGEWQLFKFIVKGIESLNYLKLGKCQQVLGFAITVEAQCGLMCPHSGIRFHVTSVREQGLELGQRKRKIRIDLAEKIKLNAKTVGIYSFGLRHLQ
jgi:hypothetical protein